MTQRVDKIYEIGEIPPLGIMPKKMYAWTLRNERLGEPITAFEKELIDLPKPERHQVIVLNMASGINYNGVWAALGHPKNVIKEHHKYEKAYDFLICGSESSGIVYDVGDEVKNIKIGDEVICIGNQYDRECPIVKKFKDPRISPSFRIWGYEGNWGAFAQFSKVEEEQCIKKPNSITWEDAASCIATGATAYSMLTHWKENKVSEGDVVLIWGGCGGVGSSSIPIVKELGGIPIAVVSSEEREKYCISIGAKGCINRTEYDHWGILTKELFDDKVKYKKWLRNVLKLRRRIWDIVGGKKDPKIVIEHPGGDTLPTSMFLCDRKGMVTICGATTGYIGSLDLRHLWLGLKRLQGSHAALQSEAEEYIKLRKERNIKATISKIYNFDELNIAHQNIYENKHEGGNMAILIGAKKAGLGRKKADE